MSHFSYLDFRLFTQYIHTFIFLWLCCVSIACDDADTQVNDLVNDMSSSSEEQDAEMQSGEMQAGEMQAGEVESGEEQAGEITAEEMQAGEMQAGTSTVDSPEWAQIDLIPDNS